MINFKPEHRVMIAVLLAEGIGQPGKLQLENSRQAKT